MDDIVKAAMRKWPNVPHCYGWLALDARGDWYMRDEPAQAAGPFPQVKGSRIEHAGCWVSSTATTNADPRPLVFPERAATGVRGAGSGALGVSPQQGLEPGPR